MQLSEKINILKNNQNIYSKICCFWIFIVASLAVSPWFFNHVQEAKSQLIIWLFLFFLGTIFFCKPLLTRSILLISSTGVFIKTMILIFILSIAVSLYIAPHKLIALDGFRVGTWIPILAVFIAYLLLSPKDIVRFTFYGAFLMAVLGILQIAFDVRTFTPNTDSGQFPAITMGNRGIATTFVALGFVPGLAMLREGGKKVKWIVFCGIIAIATFLILGLTRATWFGVLVAGVIWFFFSQKQKKPYGLLTNLSFYQKGTLILVFLVLIAVIIWLFRHEYLYSLIFDRLFVMETWVENPRFMVWYKTLEGWLQTPWYQIIFGVGPGQFQVFGHTWLAGTGLLSHGFYQEAHNDYVQTLIEWGLVGFGIRILLIMLGIKRLWRFYKDYRSFDALALVSNVCLILAVAVFFFPLTLPHLMVIFCVTLFPNLDMNKENPGMRKFQFWHYMLGRIIALIGFVLLTWHSYDRIKLEYRMHEYFWVEKSFEEKMRQKTEIQNLLKGTSAPWFYPYLIETL